MFLSRFHSWGIGACSQVNKRSELMQRARMFGTDPLAEPNRQLVPRIRYRTRRQPRIALRKRLEEEEKQAQLAASAQGRLVSFEGYGPERHTTTTLPNLKVVPLEKPEQRFLTPLAAEVAVELAALEAEANTIEGGSSGVMVEASSDGAEKATDAVARAASPLLGSRQQQQQTLEARPSAGHEGLLSPPLAGMHFPGEDQERRVRIALLSTPSGTPARTPRFDHDYEGGEGGEGGEGKDGGGRRSGLSTARSAATSESSTTSASGASGATGASSQSGSGRSGSSSGSGSSSSGSDSDEGDRRGGNLEVRPCSCSCSLSCCSRC